MPPEEAQSGETQHAEHIVPHMPDYTGMRKD